MGTYKGVYIMSINFKTKIPTPRGKICLSHEIRALSFIDNLKVFIAPQKMEGAQIVEFSTEKSLKVFKGLDMNDTFAFKMYSIADLTKDAK